MKPTDDVRSSNSIKDLVKAVRELTAVRDGLESSGVVDVVALEMVSRRIVEVVELGTVGTGLSKVPISKLGSDAPLLEKIAAFSVDGALYIDTGSKSWLEHVESQKAAEKSKTSWGRFKSVVSALLTGEVVSKERQEKRLSVCNGCSFFRWDADKLSASCGICGCKLGKKSRRLLDLTVYEETIEYGCKHPNGSRWKESNC